MLKYPFKLGENSSIFPLLGAEYDLNLTYSGNGVDKNNLTTEEKDWLNHLYIKAGLGIDLALGGNVFLRPEAVFAYKIPTAFDNDQINLEKSFGYDATIETFKFDFGLALLFGL